MSCLPSEHPCETSSSSENAFIAWKKLCRNPGESTEAPLDDGPRPRLAAPPCPNCSGTMAQPLFLLSESCSADTATGRCRRSIRNSCMVGREAAALNSPPHLLWLLRQWQRHYRSCGSRYNRHGNLVCSRPHTPIGITPRTAQACARAHRRYCRSGSFSRALSSLRALP